MVAFPVAPSESLTHHSKSLFLGLTLKLSRLYLTAVTQNHNNLYLSSGGNRNSKERRLKYRFGYLSVIYLLRLKKNPDSRSISKAAGEVASFIGYKPVSQTPGQLLIGSAPLGPQAPNNFKVYLLFKKC